MKYVLLIPLMRLWPNRTSRGGTVRNSLFSTLSALVVAGLLVPVPATAECYDPPGAYVIWAKCDFTRKNLEGANLKRAVLEDAVLRYTKLKGANLEKADLRGADVSNADMSGANLKNAKLMKAIIKDTNLSGADLTGANLEGANLERANLTGAKIDGTMLGAVRMSGATWTDGKTKCKGGSVGRCIK